MTTTPEGAINMVAAMADTLRKLPEALDDDALWLQLGRVVSQYLDECYAKGTDPDGVPWPLTKKGDKPALTGSHRDVVGFDGQVIVRMRWYDAMHHSGKAKGRVTRRMLPSEGTVPPVLFERMKAVVEQHLLKAMQVPQ